MEGVTEAQSPGAAAESGGGPPCRAVSCALLHTQTLLSSPPNTGQVVALRFTFQVNCRGCRALLRGWPGLCGDQERLRSILRCRLDFT